MQKKPIPAGVIRRLPRYHRYLETLQRCGIENISSSGLSFRMGVTASVIRQDLAYYGAFGLQGHGYKVNELQKEIAAILGMNQGYTAVIIGAGSLSAALLANVPFKKYGITVTAVYDVNPRMMEVHF